ncbi:methyltransferase domain-containing protein [Nocardioidaceae bacterium]|nr:methyltransferase domain-containing protein [Nocardioidaceae bacterium]
MSTPQTEEVFRDRERAESFGSVAEAYDRFRPGYPDGMFDDLGAMAPGSDATLLDIGCGTGRLSMGLARRGMDVLGLEIDAGMARVAREHGLDVDVDSFEDWDPAGRSFDLITCAQAWHWLDPEGAFEKAVSLLRPDGLLACCWNYPRSLPCQDDHLALYRRLAPQLEIEPPTGVVEPNLDQFEAAAAIEVVSTHRYEWTEVMTAEQWIGRVATHSDHIRLDRQHRDHLFSELQRVLEPQEPFEAAYATWLITARPRSRQGGRGRGQI